MSVPMTSQQQGPTDALVPPEDEEVMFVRAVTDLIADFMRSYFVKLMSPLHRDVSLVQLKSLCNDWGRTATIGGGLDNLILQTMTNLLITAEKSASAASSSMPRQANNPSMFEMALKDAKLVEMATSFVAKQVADNGINMRNQSIQAFRDLAAQLISNIWQTFTNAVHTDYNRLRQYFESVAMGYSQLNPDNWANAIFRHAIMQKRAEQSPLALNIQLVIQSNGDNVGGGGIDSTGRRTQSRKTLFEFVGTVIDQWMRSQYMMNDSSSSSSSTANGASTFGSNGEHSKPTAPSFVVDSFLNDDDLLRTLSNAVRVTLATYAERYIDVLPNVEPRIIQEIERYMSEAKMRLERNDANATSDEHRRLRELVTYGVPIGNMLQMIRQMGYCYSIEKQRVLVERFQEQKNSIYSQRVLGQHLKYAHRDLQETREDIVSAVDEIVQHAAKKIRRNTSEQLSSGGNGTNDQIANELSQLTANLQQVMTRLNTIENVSAPSSTSRHHHGFGQPQQQQAPSSSRRFPSPPPPQRSSRDHHQTQNGGNNQLVYHPYSDTESEASTNSDGSETTDEESSSSYSSSSVASDGDDSASYSFNMPDSQSNGFGGRTQLHDRW